MSHEDDAVLLMRAAGGEPSAVRKLLDDSGPVVYGYVYARVDGDVSTAEDLVQDVFLEAVRSAASYRGEAALATWLCAIARHRLARHYKWERRQATAEGQIKAATLVPAGGGDAGTNAVDARDEVVRALARLPVLHRQVLVLKYLDDNPVAEIASQLGRSSVQVQSLLQRARDGLRRELGAIA